MSWETRPPEQVIDKAASADERDDSEHKHVLYYSMDKDFWTSAYTFKGLTASLYLKSDRPGREQHHHIALPYLHLSGSLHILPLSVFRRRYYSLRIHC